MVDEGSSLSGIRILHLRLSASTGSLRFMVVLVEKKGIKKYLRSSWSTEFPCDCEVTKYVLILSVHFSPTRLLASWDL